MDERAITLAEQRALSDDDIKRLLPGISIIRYPDLASVSDLQNVADANNRLVIFYETEDRDTGHWTCVFKQTPMSGWTFFDPYGLRPDSERSYLTNAEAMRNGESAALLGPLLGTNGDYDHYDFQSWDGGVETCGRHCAVRLMNQSTGNADYSVLIRHEQVPYIGVGIGSAADALVTSVTMQMLGH